MNRNHTNILTWIVIGVICFGLGALAVQATNLGSGAPLPTVRITTNGATTVTPIVANQQGTTTLALSGCPSYAVSAPIAARPAGTLPEPAHPDRAAQVPITHIPDPHAANQPTFNVTLDTATRCNIAAISVEADRAGLPPELVLSLGVQEGSLGCPPTCLVGDLNLNPTGSIGTFQIYCSVHLPPGNDCHYWENPVAAMREMEPRWSYYFNVLGGWDAWQNDVYSFIAAWAPQAQGSIGWSELLARANFREGHKAYILGYLIPLAQSSGGTQVTTIQGIDPERIREILSWLTTDAIGIELRRDRLNDILAGK